MFACAAQLDYVLTLGLFLTSAVPVGAGGVRHSPKFLNSVGKRDGSGTDCHHNHTCWAGAIWILDHETFSYVTGTFNVPQVSGPRDSETGIWVGLGGQTCGNSTLVGVVCTVTGGDPVYLAKAVLLSNRTEVAASNFSNFPISSGDNIKVTINLANKTAGSATVKNLNKNIQSTVPIDSPYAICGQNAEWILQSGSYTLSDFTEVTFRDAEARGRGKATYGLVGARILEKQVDGNNVTSVTVESVQTTIWTSNSTSTTTTSQMMITREG